jgi:hypothetical protein
MNAVHDVQFSGTGFFEMLQFVINDLGRVVFTMFNFSE